MKKITNRALSVLLIAARVIVVMTVYVLRYIDNGKSWAMTFSRANSGVSGTITDRSGEVLGWFEDRCRKFSAKLGQLSPT